MGNVSTDLRQAVLQAAIQGKLTEQLPGDGNAKDLLKQIKVEKERLIKKKKIKKEKELAPITEDEIPFDIPDNWVWVKFGEISTYGQSKQKIKATDANPNCWMLDLEDIEKGGRLLAKLKVLDKKAVGDKTCFYKGDLLYSKLRPYLLKILIADEDGICTPELVPFRLYCEINAKFVIHCLKSPYIDISVNKVVYGVKMPRVGTDTMLNLLIPLPPLAEQKRIVARVEELMVKIDELEVIENNLRELHQAFPNDMKAALLQAAMQGKLTEQLPEDGNASDILSAIKKRIIVNEDDASFDIPENWQWAVLDNVAEMYTGNSISETEKTQKYVGLDSGYDYIGTKDVGFDCVIQYNNGVRIPYDNDKFRHAYAGSTLLCIEGGSAGRKIAILDRDVCFGNKLCMFNSILIDKKFLFYYLQSPDFLSAFKNKVSGIIGGVSIKKLKSMLIPVPPLAEQKRIVEKLDKLLPLCDNLKDSLY